MDFFVEHWIILLAVVAYCIAIGRYGLIIVRRAGLSSFWGILFGVPVLNIVAFWYVALVRWPLSLRNRGGE
jgi:predicted membrane protein